MAKAPDLAAAVDRLRSEMLHVPLCPVTPCTCQRFADLELLAQAAQAATLQFRAADAVMAAIDTAVDRHVLDARSPIADARLDYGMPHTAQAAQTGQMIDTSRPLGAYTDAELSKLPHTFAHKTVGCDRPAPECVGRCIATCENLEHLRLTTIQLREQLRVQAAQAGGEAEP